MAQWEADIGLRILALFALFFLIFLITRKRWARSVSVPTSLFVLNCAWLASAILYLAAENHGLLKGIPSAVAYLFIVFATPLLAAAGVLEALVVVYHVGTIKTSWPTLALRRHCLAFLSAAFCFCVYLIARRVTAP